MLCSPSTDRGTDTQLSEYIVSTPFHGFSVFFLQPIIKDRSYKGNRRICDNRRRISILEIAGKILAKFCLNRLHSHLECATEDAPPFLNQVSYQCGFRQGRGTVDMIFTARQLDLQEKSREQNRGLPITFVDQTKDFDTFNRDAL